MQLLTFKGKLGFGTGYEGSLVIDENQPEIKVDQISMERIIGEIIRKEVTDEIEENQAIPDENELNEGGAMEHLKNAIRLQISKQGELLEKMKGIGQEANIGKNLGFKRTSTMRNIELKNGKKFLFWSIESKTDDELKQEGIKGW